MKLKPIEILLVEDNEADVVLIQESLAESKLMNLMQVLGDGEEAMAYLRRKGKYGDAKMPGLILLDINMPKKSGLEVLREVKEDPALSYLPIVIMTTSSREEDIVSSYAAGACSYIRKPVEFQRFLEVIKNFELYWTLVSRIPAARG